LRIAQSVKEQMLMNWPERVWIYSPLRPVFQRREVTKWMRLAAPVDTASALEIGCGLGRGARLLAKRMGFQRIIAFDLESRLVDRAAAKLPDRFAPRISFLVADAQDLPFPDSAFDAVVNFGIIHHVLDWRRCIRELGRVTRPGGVFYFEEIYPPLYANFLLKHVVRHPTEDRFYGPQFVETLELNGFRIVTGVRTDSRFGIVGAARKI
jgi:ubiquinone/menaquinone biosynthesis C-methylase UbiE